MSRFVDEAKTAIDRWRALNADEPVPPVKVTLANGVEYTFNGLAVAPAGSSPDVVTLSASGMPLPLIVVRDSDIVRVEIGDITQHGIAFFR